jgi:AmiR/NasT family two-component response regulator
LEPLRVMIAEDEALTRTILRARLEKLGHQVVAEAENGRQAVELAAIHKPDALVMDVKLPEMDGVEAATLIALDHPCAVIFLTASAEADLVEQAAKAGAMAYLMKPFRKEDLAPALKVAMCRFRQIQTLNKEVADLKEALESRKIVERAKGILMTRHGLTEDEAFKRIHFQARNQNKKMKDIAESIITASDLI